jgi:hypothetical protein
MRLIAMPMTMALLRRSQLLFPDRLSKDWISPIYVFFKRTPRIEYVDSRRVHVFECAATHCKGKNGRDVRRFLDTGDARSTSGMGTNASRTDGPMARIEVVRWIAESKRPFAIVRDRGLLNLMKTSRPDYRLPSPAIFMTTEINIERCSGTRGLPELRD